MECFDGLLSKYQIHLNLNCNIAYLDTLQYIHTYVYTYIHDTVALLIPVASTLIVIYLNLPVTLTVIIGKRQQYSPVLVKFYYYILTMVIVLLEYISIHIHTCITNS